ncbi:MAG: histidine kinase [Methylobacterium sp.]|uniref:histidine kinase n=1 Tax=Methylobacterium sp. TaxID=409 RepID=UPI0025DA7462|nr:histidine kinase [Methylobacterium sp.]MBX9930874.1 histidine kinase [Methylobacterium sp.]
MADYYPLLARALDALPERSEELRKAVYDRARAALMGQLRSILPALSEADINRERDALEAAINRLEADQGGLPLPAGLAPEPVPPASTVPLEAVPEPEPVLPPAPPPPPIPFEQVKPPEPSTPVIPLTPRVERPKAVTEPEILVKPAGDSGSSEDAPDVQVDSANQRQRPRIDVVAPRRSNVRLLRNVFVGSVLAIVIGLIATAAYLLRDKPADLQPVAGANQSAPTDGAEAKYANRLGGETPAPERTTPPATPLNPPAAVPAQPEVAISQRAVLIEETPNGAPRVTQGRAVWRLDAVSGERGQPLETAVHATVEFAEAGLTLSLTLRRNLDATLPASHTIELAFSNNAEAGAARAVQDVGLLQAKDEENARGSPLSGLPVRVRENLFLIGLSSLTNDVERNTELLLQKNWFDLALKYAAGPRAVITFDKGSSGLQVMQNAFAQWRS